MGSHSEVLVKVEGFGDFKAQKGITIAELFKIHDITQVDGLPIILAKADNKMVDLSYKITRDIHINPLTVKDFEARRAYEASEAFLMLAAFHQLKLNGKYANLRIVVNHSSGPAYYCELTEMNSYKVVETTEEFINDLKNMMSEIASKDLPIVRERLTIDEAREYFAELGEYDKIRLLDYVSEESTIWYSLLGYKDYFYYPLVPSTGYLSGFDLKKEGKGFVLIFGDINNPYKPAKYLPRRRISELLMEYKTWARLLEVSDIGHLNSKIIEGEILDFIKMSEALHEKKLAEIADAITARGSKIVLIAGPSSSGKTTFSKRLWFHLRVNGLKPITLSLDDYFVNRELTPRDEKGDYDYEHIRALDIDLFNKHLLTLLDGGEIDIPKFDFKEGRRIGSRGKAKIDPDSGVIIIEGLHSLNPLLTEQVDDKYKFKIYVSALTQLNIDDHNRISTSDTRLIRRIVRDSKFRGYGAEDTIKRWQSVRRGEEKWIFPFQENADMMFNSALVYEHAVLKKYAMPLLMRIPRTSPVYSEAYRLLRFLSLFLDLRDEEVRYIPLNSIIREFIGGSEFEY